LRWLSRRAVVYRHALKNTLVPLASVLGPIVAFLVVGAFIIEQLFGIPGLASITVQATLADDYAVTLGTTLLLAVAVVVTYSVHLSFAEQLHARFIRSPVANTAPSVPRQVYRVAWGIAPVMAGFDFSPARQIEKRP